MKKIINTIILSTMILSGSAVAGAKYCDGYIEDWEIARWGTLYIDGDWNNSDESQALCNLDGSRFGVTAEACKAWMLTVQDATKNKNKVKLKYEGVPSCDSAILGTWSNAKTPEYIRVYSK